jgi:hypothetical protein
LADVLDTIKEVERGRERLETGATGELSLEAKERRRVRGSESVLDGAPESEAIAVSTRVRKLASDHVGE